MKLSQKEKYIQEEKNDEYRHTAIEKDAKRHCLVICCNVLQEQTGIKQEMIGQLFTFCCDQIPRRTTNRCLHQFLRQLLHYSRCGMKREVSLVKESNVKAWILRDAPRLRLNIIQSKLFHAFLWRHRTRQIHLQNQTR